MSQIFPRSSNAIAKASLALVGGLVFFAGWAALGFARSAYVTRQGVTRKQPVPFSHEHHVKGLGIDCRYCHTSVERSSFAGIPPTQTCMNCHRLIWKDSPMLAPVRESWRTGAPIEWARVHDLPDFVYFNHSIHVAKGVGCATCHGPVEKMQLMRQNASLQMEWCLECHRSPEKFVRPRSEVFNMDYRPENQAQLGPALVKEYRIRPPSSLTTCEKCHR